MRLFLITLILMTLGISSGAEEINRIDYFFIFNGGVFTHEEGKPIQAFGHFALPEFKEYSTNVQLADFTPDGDILCVLRGTNKNDANIDLARITRDLKVSPLFTIKKRSDLENGEKVDRVFGDVDYDPQTGKAIFSVIERKSKSPGLSATGVGYTSKIYRIYLKGGACELIGEHDDQIMDISAGGGSVCILRRIANDNKQSAQLNILPPGEKTWIEIPDVNSGNIISADLSPDGGSLLVLVRKLGIIEPNKLIRCALENSKITGQEVLDEINDRELGNNYRFTVDGKGITWTQKRITPWGENNLTFLMTADKRVHALVRDDFAFEYKPISSPKNKEGNVESISVVPRMINKNADIKGELSIAGVKGGSQAVLVEEFPDQAGRILNGDFEVIDNIEIGTFPNGVKGTYCADGRWFAMPELNLGERLLSFENVPYGSIYEKAPGVPPVNYEIHLSWNIGGRMVGLRVPGKEIFLGGDDKYLHLFLEYPFVGTYPASEFVTPFYFMGLNDWTIERPGYLGNYKTESHYFVKSSRDKEGNLYLLDSLNSRIIKYDKSNKPHEIGWLPEVIPSLAYPSDMFVEVDKIWVNDPINARIVVFTLSGEALKEICIDTKMGMLDDSRFISVKKDKIRLMDLREKTAWEIALNQ